MDLKSLIAWFKAEKRELPWRIDPTAYKVWISEVMLQQTQVAVVIPYFDRWMERFPTIHHLAEASMEEVIKLWEGLGYYSRARHLHEGARYIVNCCNGIIPDSIEALSKIKGLGVYTIGAILSFAFHQRRAAVDGNVVRVLSRYYLIEEDISKAKTVRAIREKAQEILPEKEPWVVAEALIELGATLCQKKPKCLQCPLRITCQAFAQGKTLTLPFKSGKNQSISLYRAVALLTCEESILIRKVEAGEIMSGLHEFPYFEIGMQGISVQELSSKIEKEFNLIAHPKNMLTEVQHSFTRYRARLFPFHFSCQHKKAVKGFQWVNIQDLDSLAFSSGHRRIKQHLPCLVGASCNTF